MIAKSYIPKIVVGLGAISVIYAFMSVGTGKNALNNNGYLANALNNNGYLAEDGSDTNQIDPLQIANALHEVMRTTNITNGNKNEVVLAALATVNVNQFYKIMVAFGKRPYNPRLGNDSTALWLNPKKYALTYWLRNELNDSE